MAKMFGDVKSDGLEESQDRLGGGYTVRESDIYTGKINMFYALKAGSGADGIFVEFEDKNGVYNETFYVTSREGKNYYEGKDRDGKPNGKRNAIPGFNIIEDLCLCTLGVPLSEVDFEDKIVDVWDKDAGKKMPKSVPVAVEILGQEVSLGILKELQNKTEKNGAGDYVPVADTVERNTVNKVFHTASKKTVTEAREKVDPPVFWDAWLKKNKGETIDRTKKDLKSSTARPGSQAQAGAPQAGQKTERKSLFN